MRSTYRTEIPAETFPLVPQLDLRANYPLGAARSAGDKHRYLHEKRSPTQSMTFFRGDSRIRTGDPLLAKQVLYQLSYTPKVVPGRR